MDADRNVQFQAVLDTGDGLFARVDALEQMSDGRTVLYEIKSSTGVSKDKTHSHIDDAAFQMICTERGEQDQ
ncbi:MAG: hypothetical protein RLW68_08175 [Devosia marina]|uniref:hypothetical protein n=1 Tax=Devosia marina TaxID=2683198 RepID=UPI0032EB83E6